MKTNVIYHKLSTKPIKAAIKAVDDCRTTWTSIDEKVRSLPKVDPVRDGTSAVERRQKELEAFDRERQSASQAAIEKIKAAAEEFSAGLEQVVFPHGDDFKKEEGDFLLLSNRLITSPQELALILDKHRESAAFRRLISRYAVSENWEGFELIDSGNTVQEFAERFFNDCVCGCEDPFSYIASAVTTEGELARRLNAYGIADNFTDI